MRQKKIEKKLDSQTTTTTTRIQKQRKKKRQYIYNTENEEKTAYHSTLTNQNDSQMPYKSRP